MSGRRITTSRRRPGRRRAAVVALVLLSACSPGAPSPRSTASSGDGRAASTGGSTSPSASATGPATTPAGEPVPRGMEIPDPLPAGRPGDLIASRAFEVIHAPFRVEGHVVAYHSRDRLGRDIPVTGTVLVPVGVPAPEGGRGVVAWAHGTRGLADGCAPSVGMEAGGGVTAFGGENYERVDDLLAAGNVVAASDYPGLGTPGIHPYLDGVGEGRSVLDSIRVARRFGGTGPAVVEGFSQGAQAAVFAGQEAPGYAPEIDLRAVVAVGTPSRYGEAFAAIDMPVVQAYLPKVLAGIVAGHPELDRSEILTPAGEASYDRFAEVADDPATCPDPTFDLPGELRADPMTVPGWRAAFEADIPGRARIAAPVLMVQSEDDEQALAFLADGVCADLVARGTDVTMWRYTGPSHVETMVVSATDRMAWVNARLAGGPAVTPTGPGGSPRVLDTCPGQPAG